jgi:hypothetical protein
MEGDIATTVALENFNAALGEEFRGGSHIGGFGVAPESDDQIQTASSRKCRDTRKSFLLMILCINRHPVHAI